MLATLIGWKVAGLSGALVATIAYYLPSALLVFGAARAMGALARLPLADRDRARPRPGRSRALPLGWDRRPARVAGGLAGMGGGDRHDSGPPALARPAPGAAPPRRRGALRPPRARLMKTPVVIFPEALDFARLVRAGDTVGWAEATAEPVFLTRLLDRDTPRCPPFRVFFALTFADDFTADHPNVTVTALGGGGARAAVFRW